MSNLETSSWNEDQKNASGLKSGAYILVVLHSPKEKCWGLLDEISPAGVFLRGIDLNSFDDWIQAIANEEPFGGLVDLFFPMWRVERLTRDERSGDIPSLAERFESRIGRAPRDFA